MGGVGVGEHVREPGEGEGTSDGSVDDYTHIDKYVVDPSMRIELSVQSIVDENIKEVPSLFVKPERVLVPIGALDEGIPMIDMAAPDAADQIVTASKEWGVFQVINHGISEELLDRVEQLSVQYFSMPKEDILLDKNFFVPKDGSRDWNDCLLHFVVPPQVDTLGRTKWPENYRETLNEFVGESLKLVTRVVQTALGPALGLPPNRLLEAVGDINVAVRVNHYPPCPEPEKVLGLTSHTDHCLATVLVLDEVPGLQVFKSGQWVNVRPVKNALVFFVANVLEILSNGIYKSIAHRVIVNEHKERMSLGVFHNLAHEIFIEPLPELVDEDHPPVYRRVQFGQTFQDFAKSGLDGRAFLNTLRVNQDQKMDH